MKKFTSLALAAALAAGMAVPALAAGLPEGWTPADGARDLPAPEVVDVPVGDHYAATVTVDGVELDLSGIPGAPAGYVPMRAVCEATRSGIAEWYSDDNQALFFLDEQSIFVDFNTMTVQKFFEPVDGLTPYLDPSGYTFLPVSFLDGLGQVTVDTNPELDVERYDIKTSASDPMVQLSNSILDACEMPNVSTVSQDMLDSLEFDMSNYTHLVARAPMMNTMSYTLFIAEVAEGKMDAAKVDFQAYQDLQKRNFEHYLPGPYDMAQNGQIVVSPDGAHLLLVISEQNDKAIELFNAAYPAAE